MTYTVFQKTATSSTISGTRIVSFHYQQYRPSTGVFIFPPHLFRAPTLPWETVKT